MATVAGASSVRSRSFGGCTTCRERRTKCDEAKPSCGPCGDAGVICEGYEAKISFLVYLSTDKHFDWAHGWSKSEQERQSGARRPLAAEKSRARMAKAMYNSVSSLNLKRSFAELELHGDRSSSDESLFRGPFGSFRPHAHTPDIILDGQLDAPVTRASKSSKRKRTSLTEVTPSLQPQVVDNDGLEACSASNLELSINHGVPGYEVADLALLEATVDIGPINFDEVPSLSLWEEEELIDHAGDDNSQEWQSMLPFEIVDPTDFYRQEAFLNKEASALSVGLPVLESGHPDNMFIMTVDHLLDHYRDQMGRLFSPLRIRNSPWAVQFLPSVMSTLCDLTVWNWVSPIRLSLLYSLLAVSAFNLDKIELQRVGGTDRWWVVGKIFKDNAIKQTQLWLSAGLHGPTVSSYKENLMAFLTLVTMTVRILSQ